LRDSSTAMWINRIVSNLQKTRKIHAGNSL